jgi:hypothetical protein
MRQIPSPPLSWRDFGILILLLFVGVVEIRCHPVIISDSFWKHPDYWNVLFTGMVAWLLLGNLLKFLWEKLLKSNPHAALKFMKLTVGWVLPESVAIVVVDKRLKRRRASDSDVMA